MNFVSLRMGSQGGRPGAILRPGGHNAAMLEGLASIVDRLTRIVILGSFPGAASLAAQQYYGLPRNHFWPLLSALWGEDLVALDYPSRLDALRRHGVGLWDVYARC